MAGSGSAATPLPGTSATARMDRRYRCTSCGNLTRFTVTRLRRTRSFHHYTLGGDLSIEDEEVLDDIVEAVSCRWCGTASGVEEFSDVPPESGA